MDRNKEEKSIRQNWLQHMAHFKEMGAQMFHLDQLFALYSSKTCSIGLFLNGKS